MDDGRGLILIGLGANLPSPCGPPLATCEAALESLGEAGVTVTRRSRWFRSPPMPPSSQPWFVNGVAVIDTDLDSPGLLALRHHLQLLQQMTCALSVQFDLEGGVNL